MCQGGAHLLAMVERLGLDCRSLRNGHHREDQGPAKGDLPMALQPLL